MLSNKSLSLLINLLKGIFILCISFAASGCETLNKAKEEVTRDQLITRHIKHALYKNEIVPKAGHFTVTSEKGAVTLSGLADNIEQKHQAIEIAKGTQGVEKVESAITIANSLQARSFDDEAE